MYFKIGKLKNPEYLKWIRLQPCIVCGNVPSIPHHFLSGTSKRNIDLATVPMDDKCHKVWHGSRFISQMDMVELSYKYITEYMNDSQA